MKLATVTREYPRQYKTTVKHFTIAKTGKDQWKGVTRDEGTRMDSVVLGGCCSRQTTVVLSGGGIMLKPACRGQTWTWWIKKYRSLSESLSFRSTVWRLFNDSDDEDDDAPKWLLLELFVVMTLAVVTGGTRSLVTLLVTPDPPLFDLTRPITGSVRPVDTAIGVHTKSWK